MIPATIHNLHDGSRYYVVTALEDCRSDLEEEAFRLADTHGQTIALGSIVCVPLTLETIAEECNRTWQACQNGNFEDYQAHQKANLAWAMLVKKNKTNPQLTSP